MAISITKPTVGGSEDTWGTTINTALDTIVDALNGTTGTTAPNLTEGSWQIGGTPVTATADELNYVAGVTSSIQTQLDTILSTLIPSGVITMWSGSVASIPSGWVLCDGNNSTPNLQDRFVVGAGSSYAVDATGGEATVALDASEMPSHTHTFSGTTNEDGAHTHTVPHSTISGAGAGGNIAGGYPTPSTSETTSEAGAHTHSFSGTTSSAGSGSAHENRPPYYALAYIMKT